MMTEVQQLSSKWWSWILGSLILPRGSQFEVLIPFLKFLVPNYIVNKVSHKIRNILGPMLVPSLWNL